MTLLSTHKLTKTFGGLRAVDAVDFNLHQGEVRALIGPNGAGKTTFVGLVCGRMAPTSGSISFEDQDISNLPNHQRIALGMGYTFQITSIFANLPVKENVALAVRRRWPDANNLIDEKVWQAIATVGLLDRIDAIAGDLSYGHQRLLELAMGLAPEPKLLLLDEPTQGLADDEIHAFISMIDRLREQTTILLIEHNMRVVMQTADRITVLNFGQVLVEDKPEIIRSDRAVQAAYLGTA